MSLLQQKRLLSAVAQSGAISHKAVQAGRPAWAVSIAQLMLQLHAFPVNRTRQARARSLDRRIAGESCASSVGA